MERNWLFLRGIFDANNKYNAKHDLDMWRQLFDGLAGDNGYVWYKGWKVPRNVTHIFARGGFDFYLPILKMYKNAYKIYYGAGKRYIPKDGINYNLILVDSEEQKKKLLKKFPKANVQIFFKPAANHFKPIDVEKKYDVGFVATIPEDKRKRVAWVYKTVPKDLKVLQLGYTPKKLKIPKNVKVKKATSDKMPKLISQCKVIICPYSELDSGPRIIPEALACGVPVVCRESVNFDNNSYTYVWVTDKETFWKDVKNMLSIELKHVHEGYKIVSSMEEAVSHLRRLI